jgi:hypothetical protein
MGVGERGLRVVSALFGVKSSGAGPLKLGFLEDVEARMIQGSNLLEYFCKNTVANVTAHTSLYSQLPMH